MLIVASLSTFKTMNALEDSARREVLLIAGNLSGMVELALAEELKLIREFSVRNSVVETAGRIAREGQTSASVEEDRVKLAKELLALQKEMGTQNYEGFFVTDLGGIIFAEGSDINFKGLNLGERDYVKNGLAGKTTIGKIALSKKSGKPIVSLGAPVLLEGKVVGAVGIVMKPDFFVDKISATKIGETGQAFLMDEAGVILAHPQADLIFKANLKDLPGMDSITSKILSGTAGVEGFEAGGMEKIVAHAPSQMTGWTVGATQNRSEFMKPVYAIVRGIALAGAIFLLLSVVTAVYFGRRVSQPIARAVEGLSEVAVQVAAAAGQVSSASLHLADGTSQQASAIEETSSSLEEMSSMTRQNADNASQANRLMKEASDTVANANRLMGDLNASMGEITRASQDTQKIVKTIDEIAFQTNLLALNAAVEAARAGEAGAGFAVVADEVRSLAQRAAAAARNTADLIEGTVKRIHLGTDVVSKTDKEFSLLAASVGKSGELVGEIAAASNEQAQGIIQISKAIAEIEQVIQQNSASAEESASASEEMNAQASQMTVFADELAASIGAHTDTGGNPKKPAKTAAPAANPKRRRVPAPAPVKPEPDRAVAQPPAREMRPEEVIPFDDF